LIIHAVKLRAKKMTYTNGNPGPGLEHAQKCGGIKWIDVTLPP
jgi:hypothetical protein